MSTRTLFPLITEFLLVCKPFRAVLEFSKKCRGILLGFRSYFFEQLSQPGLSDFLNSCCHNVTKLAQVTEENNLECIFVRTSVRFKNASLGRPDLKKIGKFVPWRLFQNIRTGSIDSTILVSFLIKDHPGRSN